MGRVLGQLRAPALAAAATVLPAAAGAATVHLTDIVANPVALNDFELAPAFVPTTWAQQGVRATQVGANPADSIWLASGLGDGSRSFYPDGGDTGWTRLSLDGGMNFDAVSFLGGVGWLGLPVSLYYELADDGVVVASGTLAAQYAGSWFGFSGGDFDEVRLRGSPGWLNSLADCPHAGPGLGNCNWAWVDNIRVGAAALPLPTSAALAAAGLLLLGATRLKPGASHG